jgi:hypothetical protein
VLIRASLTRAVVAQQEMLHLALVGNLITAIDSGPKLYAKDVVPTYGGLDDTILSSDIPLKLERCEKSNLELFLRVRTSQLTMGNIGLPLPKRKA